MTRTIVRASALTALALFASSAAAQAPAASAPPSPGASAPSAGAAVPLADALQGAAKTAYDSAKLLAQNHDFATALAEFGHAYSLSKDPRLLFNMAICQKELHHYAKMRGLLEQYLREGARVATAESMSAAQDALAAIKPLVAALKITVNQDGAEVTVDGEVIGTTPLTGSVPVDLGRRVVSVKKPGFDPFEQALDMPGGTEAAVNVSLKEQRHVGQLVVTADPGSTVIVDGKEVGQGKFDGAVASGGHEVSVSAPGKKTYDVQVELRDGETRSMQVTLEDASHGSPIWPWIVGGAVVAAGAAVGGYFLFKPSDTTTEGAPKGTFGTVQFNAWSPR